MLSVTAAQYLSMKKDPVCFVFYLLFTVQRDYKMMSHFPSTYELSEIYLRVEHCQGKRNACVRDKSFR